MSLKMINVDGGKWNIFKKWCVANDTTMIAELDKFLDKFKKVEA